MQNYMIVLVIIVCYTKNRFPVTFLRAFMEQEMGKVKI